jgi:hypothetical protein
MDRKRPLFDLFRVEGGKRAENCGAIGTIPPRVQWKNDNDGRPRQVWPGHFELEPDPA